MKKILPVLMVVLTLVTSVAVISCHSNHHPENTYGADIDTLKVVTLYSPLTYFIYRGEPMGIDYENVKKFAADEGMTLELQTVNNIPELIESLKTGKAHLAAFPIPSIAEYNSEVLHCGPQEITRQVLVQKNGADKVTDVTQLVGKDVYVEKDSKYHYRLENLNEELGGGINIHAIENDTIVPEDLMMMVESGEIEYTVVDSRIAEIFKDAFPDLDVNLKLSADQASSWATAIGLDSLAAKIDRWENRTHSSEFIREIYKNYWDNSLKAENDAKLSYFKKTLKKKGSPISPYDTYFKKHASTAGYDWQLLAAIAYCESGFNPSVASRFGAYGLMQVMPSSAAAFGVDPSLLGDPDYNILAAAKILSKLDKSFKDLIPDREERLKFVAAAYNSGPAHIYDAIALANKIGLDPEKWNANVSVAALMKSRPEYYNDPVVKYGYFRGRETVNFVDHVTSIYNFLKENT